MSYAERLDKGEGGLDLERREEFSGRMLQIMNEAALCLMISTGHRTGLFDRMAELPAATSVEIAEYAGLNERYVREWLAALTVGGVIEYDARRKTYTLPAEHGAWLTRQAGQNNIAVLTQYIPLLGSIEDEIVECFRRGGGVPYSSFKRFHEVMAEDSGQSLLPVLLDKVVPLVPGLGEELTRGVNVLDIGCGRGRVLNQLAREFPSSRFTGFDISIDAIEYARAEARKSDIVNITFAVQDVARLNENERYFLITAFDAIHDQAKPAVVLRNIYNALEPRGVFLMQDIAASRYLDQNLDHPIGALLYTISCMHCMTVSLAQGGDGLGTAWGIELAEEMLRSAGFRQIEIKRLEHDIQNCYYVVRK